MDIFKDWDNTNGSNTASIDIALLSLVRRTVMHITAEPVRGQAHTEPVQESEWRVSLENHTHSHHVAGLSSSDRNDSEPDLTVYISSSYFMLIVQYYSILL